MKTNFTADQLQQITSLFNKKLGSRKIAKIMEVNRSTIIKAYKQLGLDSASVKTPRFAYLKTEKCCKICNEIKNIDNFRQRVKCNRVSYETYCLNCEKVLSNKRSNNRYKNNKKWYINYRQDNLSKIKVYLKKYLKQYRKNRMLIDPEFKIRSKISTAIYVGLKKNNSCKNEGCWKYLDYSPKELKEYLEKQFEPWMNWENHGMYKSNIWKDNDQSTWTWQLDHIIPQSNLPYTSMKDINFKKCWQLSNLRPLSAKQNLLDGVNKIRHIAIY